MKAPFENGIMLLSKGVFDMKKVLTGLLSIIFVLSVFTGCGDPYKDQVFSSDFDENDLGGLFIGDISLDVPGSWEDTEMVEGDKKENLRIYKLGSHDGYCTFFKISERFDLSDEAVLEYLKSEYSDIKQWQKQEEEINTKDSFIYRGYDKEAEKCYDVALTPFGEDIYRIEITSPYEENINFSKDIDKILSTKQSIEEKSNSVMSETANGTLTSFLNMFPEGTTVEQEDQTTAIYMIPVSDFSESGFKETLEQIFTGVALIEMSNSLLYGIDTIQYTVVDPDDVMVFEMITTVVDGEATTETTNVSAKYFELLQKTVE